MSMSNATRREFLRRATALSAVGAAASTFGFQLATMGSAAAQTSTPYKALVCIFLYGGNDHNSTLMPFDSTNYDLYSAIRGGGAGQTAGGITLARASLAATAHAAGDGLLSDARSLSAAVQLAVNNVTKQRKVRRCWLFALQRLHGSDQFGHTFLRNDAPRKTHDDAFRRQPTLGA